jgi:hypothetical protein
MSTPAPDPVPLTTEARGIIATALANTGYLVYDVSPEIPKPPCVVITPDSPWIRIDRIGSNLNYQVRLRILVVVANKRNNAQQNAIESAVDTILAALPATVRPDIVGPPSLTDIGAQGTVTTAEINVSVHM